MTFTDEQLEAYVTWDHPAIRDLARALLDARKALEAVPHLIYTDLDGYSIGQHSDLEPWRGVCAAGGGACNARRVLEGKR